MNTNSLQVKYFCFEVIPNSVMFYFKYILLHFISWIDSETRGKKCHNVLLKHGLSKYIKNKKQRTHNWRFKTCEGIHLKYFQNKRNVFNDMTINI